MPLPENPCAQGNHPLLAGLRSPRPIFAIDLHTCKLGAQEVGFSQTWKEIHPSAQNLSRRGRSVFCNQLIAHQIEDAT